MKEKYGESISDFCLLNVPKNARLSNFERLTLIGGLELDKSVNWLKNKLNKFSWNNLVDDISVSELRKASNYYNTLFQKDNLASFYSHITSIPKIDYKVIHGLRDGAIIDLAFESAYNSRHVDFIERLHSYKENSTVHARMWKHDGQSVGTIITIHGWTMGDQRLSSLAFQPGYFYSQGFNVVLFELPFHGRRKVKTKDSISSVPFPSSDVILTNEAIGQSIYDLRCLKAWLESNDQYSQIGCMGMSLGGYVSALFASLDELAFCIPVVPLVSMSEIAYKILEASPNYSKFVDEGLTKELLEALYYMHSPLNFKPKMSKEQFLIIGGKNDRVLPEEHTRMLYNHWNYPKLHWFNGGHFALFEREKVFFRIKSFFADLGLLI